MAPLQGPLVLLITESSLQPLMVTSCGQWWPRGQEAMGEPGVTVSKQECRETAQQLLPIITSASAGLFPHLGESTVLCALGNAAPEMQTAGARL